MDRKKLICKSAVFIVLFLVAIFLKNIFNNEWFCASHAYELIILDLVIYFILGNFLSLGSRMMSLKNIHFHLHYFLVVLICMLLIVLCYILYNYLPAVIVNNLDTIDLFFASYAGANFPSIFFDENK